MEWWMNGRMVQRQRRRGHATAAGIQYAVQNQKKKRITAPRLILSVT